ncbi:putative sulfate exporter family transporter, partial [Streptococcus suis]
MTISSHQATMIVLGTSICGFAAIAANDHLNHTYDEDLAQEISVINIFKFFSSIVFPIMANCNLFSTDSRQAYVIIAA